MTLLPAGVKVHMALGYVDMRKGIDGLAMLVQVRTGPPVDAAMAQTGVPAHVQAFVAHTMALAHSGSTEEVLAAFFYGREDIIPEMFSRLLKTLHGARHSNECLRHLIYYIDRHIELDGDSHGPMGGSCSKISLRTRPKRASGLCAPLAAALRPGSTFGMAH
jgi:hypothetical protein